MQLLRRLKEILGTYCEELRRAGSGVWIKFRLVASVHAVLEMDIRALKRVMPDLVIHRRVQGWVPVTVAVEHIQLVGQFMNQYLEWHPV